MGGTGSGRKWYFDSKETTDDYRRLDIRRWQRDCLLEASKAFSWQWSRNGETIASINVIMERDRVILTYRHKRGDEEWKDECYPVRIERTPCHYGGSRAWFICPARECSRRVAILYSGGIFACRHCYRLAYPSQRENPYDLDARRADKIRNRLNWEPGILNSSGEKPKGMHWRTYKKLVREHDASVEKSLAGMAKRLGILKSALYDVFDG